VKLSTFDTLGFARTEPDRIRRQGFPEAIFCPGKTEPQILKIFASLLKGPGPVLATRVAPSVAKNITRAFPNAVYHETARLVVAKPLPRRKGRSVCVLSAGTADLRAAEEAAVTAESLGRSVKRIYDVGVAAIDRLMAHRKVISKAAVIVVCAGMEGALASVVGGLAACPVIAVPTSIGYGTHMKGVAALLTMMNSCAANVSVVNIDNGFGAGVIASLITK
jgi:NCAIR mutase (PurE)-related protein